jgi:hypothetical protein
MVPVQEEKSKPGGKKDAKKEQPPPDPEPEPSLDENGGMYDGRPSLIGTLLLIYTCICTIL